MGIIIDETLSWEDHIEYISTKIKCGIGALGRSKNILSKEHLNMLYKTLTESYFRYGNTVWDQCHQTSLDRLQSMQNRGARIITGISYEDANHPSILCRRSWLSIRHLTVLDLAVATFKVAKGIAPPPTQKMFHYISELYSYDTRSVSSGNLKLKSVRLTVEKSATSYIGPKTWNGIENQIKQLKLYKHSRERFKKCSLTNRSTSELSY